MRKILWSCDRCKKSVEEKNINQIVINTKCYLTDRSYELCKNCKKELIKFMEGKA